MNKNRKGFTLMEMLGVIIVLTIIAVITIPIMINIVERTRKNAAKNTALGYLSGVEEYIELNELGNEKYSNTIEKEKVYQVSEVNYEAIDEDEIKDKEIVENSNINNLIGTTIKGDKPSEGIISLDAKGKVVYAELIIKKYIIICTSDTSCNVSIAYKDRVKPKLTIGNVTSTKDSITVPYTLVTGSSGASVECLYGESEDNIKSKGVVDENNNKCELSNLKSDTTYYFKLTPTSGEGLVGKSVSGNIITQKGTISAILQKDGEKESDGKYYYDKDTTTNNIILGDYCWLAINTDEEGNTRLIYNGEVKDGQCTGENASIGTSVYSDDSTITNYNDSVVKTVVDSWYNDNLSTTYGEKISIIDLIFKEEATIVGGGYLVSGQQFWTQTSTGENLSKVGECVPKKDSKELGSSLTGKFYSVGIYTIDVDGAIVVSDNGKYYAEITGVYRKCATWNYCATINKKTSCWSCKSEGDHAASATAKGNLCCSYSDEEVNGSCKKIYTESILVVRPVITLNNTLTIQDGNGTSTKPYILN